MRRRLIAPSMLLLGLSLTLGSCGTPSAPTPAAPPQVSAPTATPSVTAAPSPSATTKKPKVPPAERPVTAAQLRKALLDIHDVPASFELVKGQDDDGDHASSKKSGCADLVRLLNAAKLPGSLASAGVGFDGGQDGAFVGEDLDALASSTAAQNFVAGYRRSVKSCQAVRYRVPGVGSSTLDVRPISFTEIGDASFVARFRASRGPLAGLEITQVGAHLGAVVMGMSFIGLDPSDAEEASQVAADKVQSILGSSATT